MKILKFLKNTSKTTLYFSSKCNFHVAHSRKALLRRLPATFSFPFRSTKNKTDEFNDLLNLNKRNETMDETSVAEETLYEPKETIKFINGLCQIYENEGYSSSRNGLTMVALIACFFLYQFIKRLRRHIGNRKIFRSLFYLMLITMCVIFLRTLKTFQIVVKSLDLCADGKHIILTHPKFLVLLNRKKVDISNIQRPLKVDDSSLQWMEYGYPIVAQNEFYTLARSGTIHNKELLPVILNGRYINTKGESQTVDI